MSRHPVLPNLNYAYHDFEMESINNARNSRDGLISGLPLGLRTRAGATTIPDTAVYELAPFAFDDIPVGTDISTYVADVLFDDALVAHATAGADQQNVKFLLDYKVGAFHWNTLEFMFRRNPDGSWGLEASRYDPAGFRDGFANTDDADKEIDERAGEAVNAVIERFKLYHPGAEVNRENVGRKEFTPKQRQGVGCGVFSSHIKHQLKFANYDDDRLKHLFDGFPLTAARELDEQTQRARDIALVRATRPQDANKFGQLSRAGFVDPRLYLSSTATSRPTALPSSPSDSSYFAGMEGQFLFEEIVRYCADDFPHLFGYEIKTIDQLLDIISLQAIDPAKKDLLERRRRLYNMVSEIKGGLVKLGEPDDLFCAMFKTSDYVINDDARISRSDSISKEIEGEIRGLGGHNLEALEIYKAVFWEYALMDGAIVNDRLKADVRAKFLEIVGGNHKQQCKEIIDLLKIYGIQGGEEEDDVEYGLKYINPDDGAYVAVTLTVEPENQTLNFGGVEYNIVDGQLVVPGAADAVDPAIYSNILTNLKAANKSYQEKRQEFRSLLEEIREAGLTVDRNRIAVEIEGRKLTITTDAVRVFDDFASGNYLTHKMGDEDDLRAYDLQELTVEINRFKVLAQVGLTNFRKRKIIALLNEIGVGARLKVSGDIFIEKGVANEFTFINPTATRNPIRIAADGAVADPDIYLEIIQELKKIKGQINVLQSSINILREELHIEDNVEFSHAGEKYRIVDNKIIRSDGDEAVSLEDQIKVAKGKRSEIRHQFISCFNYCDALVSNRTRNFKIDDVKYSVTKEGVDITLSGGQKCSFTKRSGKKPSEMIVAEGYAEELSVSLSKMVVKLKNSHDKAAQLEKLSKRDVLSTADSHAVSHTVEGLTLSPEDRKKISMREVMPRSKITLFHFGDKLCKLRFDRGLVEQYDEVNGEFTLDLDDGLLNALDAVKDNVPAASSYKTKLEFLEKELAAKLAKLKATNPAITSIEFGEGYVFKGGKITHPKIKAEDKDEDLLKVAFEYLTEPNLQPFIEYVGTTSAKDWYRDLTISSGLAREPTTNLAKLFAKNPTATAPTAPTTPQEIHPRFAYYNRISKRDFTGKDVFKDVKDLFMVSMVNCTFEGVDFSNVKNLHTVQFVNCKINFDNCIFPPEFKFKKTQFQGDRNVFDNHEGEVKAAREAAAGNKYKIKKGVLEKAPSPAPARATAKGIDVTMERIREPIK